MPDNQKGRLNRELSQRAQENLERKAQGVHKDEAAELRKAATKRTNLQRGGAASQKKSAASRAAEEGKRKEK